MSEKELIQKKSEEEEVDALFARRESVDLTPENAKFSTSEGGLLSLELSVPGKEKEVFERVSLLRTFPLSNPDEFLSVREPDSMENGHGYEIGMIRRISDFDGHGREAIDAELGRRYFIPKIERINSAKDKYGHSYWNVDTTAGNLDIVISNPYSNIRLLDDGRLLIEDMEGNCFYIESKEALDRASYKKIEIYF